jgi:CBS domain-containing protein
VELVDSGMRREPVDPVDEATGPLLDWLSTLDRFDALGPYARRLCDIAGRLLDADADAVLASRAISTANDALTVRLIELAENRLGPPPGPYAWLALGSAGRWEEALHSDQDSALAYCDRADDAYFAALAELVVGGLRDAGRPLCPGGYMATRWRYPLDEWAGLFRRWVERPEPLELIEAEVLLDFRRVHGQLSPAPLDDIFRRGPYHPRFLIHMAGAAIAFAPPLGLFGRLRVGGHIARTADRNKVDLKRGGLAAIVLLGRVYALAARCVARPTAERLAAAADGGVLSHEGAGRLTEAYHFLSRLRLRTQVQRIASGGVADSLVGLDDLSLAERKHLRDAFRTVQHIQQATALRFHTEALP